MNNRIDASVPLIRIVTPPGLEHAQCYSMGECRVIVEDFICQSANKVAL